MSMSMHKTTMERDITTMSMHKTSNHRATARRPSRYRTGSMRSRMRTIVWRNRCSQNAMIYRKRSTSSTDMSSKELNALWSEYESKCKAMRSSENKAWLGIMNKFHFPMPSPMMTHNHCFIRSEHRERGPSSEWNRNDLKNQSVAVWPRGNA